MNTKAEQLAREMVKLLGVRQGSIEIHVNKGCPTGINRLDKSIKFVTVPDSSK